MGEFYDALPEPKPINNLGEDLDIPERMRSYSEEKVENLPKKMNMESKMVENSSDINERFDQMNIYSNKYL